MTRQAGLQSESVRAEIFLIRSFLLVKGTGSPITGKGTKLTYGSYLFALSIESLARLGTSTFQEQGNSNWKAFKPDFFHLSFDKTFKWKGLLEIIIPGLVLGQGVWTFSQWEGIKEAAMDGKELELAPREGRAKATEGTKKTPKVERCYEYS